MCDLLSFLERHLLYDVHMVRGLGWVLLDQCLHILPIARLADTPIALAIATIIEVGTQSNCFISVVVHAITVKGVPFFLGQGIPTHAALAWTSATSGPSRTQTLASTKATTSMMTSSAHLAPTTQCTQHNLL